MSDDVWRRDEIKSPCINVCVLHPQSKLCIGCYRDMTEITQWARMSPEERAKITSELPDRAEQVKGKRRGGHAARIKGKRGR